MSLTSFRKIEEIMQLVKSGKKLVILDTEGYHTIPFLDKNGKMIAIYGNASSSSYTKEIT
jgi:hypothetical protein